MSLINIDEEKCVGCNSCIRVCPSPLANKAYMDTSVPTINPVRGFKIGFSIDDSIINDNDGFVDGINEVQATDENIIYDLNGLRVNTLRKGIFIVNGKKLVITDNNR